MALPNAYLEKFKELLRKSREAPNAVQELLSFAESVLHSPDVFYLDHFQYNRPNSPEYKYASVSEAIETHREEIIKRYESLKPLMNSPFLNSVTQEKVNDTDPYWNNGFFNGGDARAAYALAASTKPRLIAEIGSGNSTKFFRKAIRDFNLSTQLISIDPAPRAEIKGLADHQVEKSMLEIPLDFYDTLVPGDILFFDGSHLAFNGSDVTHMFLNAFPRIKKGVLVHVHDIMLPYEYIDIFTQRMYNEQYLLALVLMQPSAWKTVLPLYWLSKNGIAEPGHDGVSFWMTKN